VRAAIGADGAENTISLLLFTSHYLATDVVYLFISRSFSSNGSAFHNMLKTGSSNFLTIT
jgi:hypothetical protein